MDNRPFVADQSAICPFLGGIGEKDDYYSENSWISDGLHVLECQIARSSNVREHDMFVRSGLDIL